MSTPDTISIPDTTQKVKKLLTWFIEEILRGDWFTKAVFILVIIAICGSPSFLGKIPFLQQWQPSWLYWLIYLGLLGLFLIISIFIGLRTIPRFRKLPPEVDIPAVRGLLPFNENDSELFIRLGRRSDLQRILTCINDPSFRFGLLVGTSGSGKTSFLRAGVLPRLKVKGGPACYVELSNRDPIATINGVLAAQGIGKGPATILLDQFEQLFLHRSEHERQPLIQTLKEWYTGDSGIRVLVSIRAEDLWRMEELQRNLEYQLTTSNYFTLTKFGADQTTEILKELCEPAGIQFDPTFAHNVVERDFLDAEDGLVSPVTIGIVIQMIAAGNRQFTAEGFKSRMGVATLLEDWLNSQLQAAENTSLGRTPIKILTFLCDFDHERRAGSFTVESIVTGLRDELPAKQTQLALDWATRPDVRLIVRIDIAEEVRYQLMHERLIPAIRKAAGKLLTEAQAATQLLERRTTDWVANNRKRRFLLNAFEYLRIRRQWAYLIWGGNRSDKEELIRRSARRIKTSVALAGAFFLLLVLIRPVWTSQFVQRKYVASQLRALAKRFPSRASASALATLGDLNDAEDVTDRVDYLDTESQRTAKAEMAAETGRIALLERNERLLQQCIKVIEDVGGEDSSPSLAAVAAAMVKEARIRGDDSLVDRGLQLFHAADSQHPYSWSDPMALEAISTGLARKNQKLFDFGVFLAGRHDTETENALDVVTELVASSRTDLAIALANSQDSEPKSKLLNRIAVELAKARHFDNALHVANSLPADRTKTLNDIAVALGEQAKIKGDPDLLRTALNIAQSVGTPDPAVVQRIAIDTAVVGKLRGDRGLLVQAKNSNARWGPEDMGPWEIAYAAGDGDAEKILGDVENAITREHAQGPSPTEMKNVPIEMMAFAIEIKDKGLQDQAVKVVESINSTVQVEALEKMLTMIDGVDKDNIAEDLLEDFWAETEQGIESDTLIEGILRNMVKIGYLNRARELAETRSGLHRTNCLAAIVLADSKRIEGRDF